MWLAGCQLTSAGHSGTLPTVAQSPAYPPHADASQQERPVQPARCQQASSEPDSQRAFAVSGEKPAKSHIRASAEEGPPAVQTAGEFLNNAECSCPNNYGCHGCQARPILSFESDLEDFLPRLRDDAHGVANWTNAAYLAVALGGAIAIRQDLDDEIREQTAGHPERWGEGTKFLGKIGEAPYQVPVLLGFYAYSVRRQDDELHDLMTTMISAYTLSGLTTVAIKGIANTDRPSDEWNGGQFGFPSFHTASTFTIAAVLDEYYGCRAGLPAYTLAGLVSWSRIDERDHDLSDVVFGAAMGYVIGKSVAGRHLYGDSRVRILPYVHPSDGSSGLALDLEF